MIMREHIFLILFQAYEMERSLETMYSRLLQLCNTEYR